MLRKQPTPSSLSRAGRWVRLGGAALIGATMALTMSGVALAEDDKTAATVNAEGGVSVWLEGSSSPVSTAMLSITYDGTTELAYCIDLTHGVVTGQPQYVAEDWDSSGVDNLSNIKWILTNSYPTATAADVAAAATATVPTGTATERLEQLVYAGTQTAIWHNSDGAVLAAYQNSNSVTSAEYAVIQKVYEYLVGQAAKAPTESDPEPTLVLSPSTATATVGEKAGPYTVTSGGGDTTLTVTGGTIVDKNGNELTTLQDGDEFWVTTDAAGTVTIEATGSGSVPIGRVFVYGPAADNHQKIILAGAVGTDLKASATATFSEAGPSLPVTGSSTIIAVATGLVLLAGGAVVLMTIRRRKIRFTA